MYVSPNFKTKKALKEAVAAGKRVECFNNSLFGPDVLQGTQSVEGPHYPEPHRWYARVAVADGIVTKVLS